MIFVNDLMTVNPMTVAPDTPLRRIVETMRREGCRQLPVVDEDKLVGIVTDRDVRLVLNLPLMRHGRWQEKEMLDRLTAESCMTTDPITATPDTPAYRAAEMLGIYKFGALPVVDGERLVGIITVTDFLQAFASQEEAASTPVSGKRSEMQGQR